MALSKYLGALRVREVALGRDHISMGNTYNNMGFMYELKGEYNHAVSAYQESLRIKRNSLGDDHPSVAESLNNIGVAHAKHGELKEALEAFESALFIYQNSASFAYSDNHPEVTRTQRNIARCKKFLEDPAPP